MEPDLNTKIEELRSMNGLKSSRPDMPVHVVTQEAVELFEWCQKDKEELIKAGLDWHNVEELRVRAEVLVKLEALWMSEYGDSEEIQKEWKAALPLAVALRKEMTHYFLNAFRSLPDVLSKVGSMSKGRTIAEVLQGLYELSELGSLHIIELKRAGVDIGILEKAKMTSVELTGMHAKVIAVTKGGSMNLKLRNRAFYHLREALEEVRRIGKFVFWKNENRYKGYVSDFLRSKYLKHSHSKNSK